MHIYPCCNLNIFRNENSKLSPPYLTKTFRRKKFPSHPPYLVSYVWVKSNDENFDMDENIDRPILWKYQCKFLYQCKY